MNILFTFCGRAGSKGFKNKNLKTFCGAPLVYNGIAGAAMYKEKYEKEDRIDFVLSTDSKELIDIVRKQKTLPVNVIRRTEELSGDKVAKAAVIKDCLIQMENREGVKYDVLVDLDITSPLRTVADIRNAIEKKLSRSDTDVVYSVTDSRRNPCFNMAKKENAYFVPVIEMDITTRQEAPAFYDLNASIYAYSTRALKDKDSDIFFHDKCDAIMMKDTAVLDIDSEEDFELMQIIAEYLFEKYPEYGEIASRAKEMVRII